MAKQKNSTRRPEMNYYLDENGVLNSAVSVSATKSHRNIKLLEYDDYIIVSGKDIIKEASDNHRLYGEPEYNPIINTDNIDETKDYLVYGTPHKWVLDNEQLCDNCGVEAVLNILVMAGQKVITDQNKVEYAFTKDLWERRDELNLISIDDVVKGVFDENDGGMNAIEFPIVFAEYGIEATYYDSVKTEKITLEEIAPIIKEGGAAIVGVCAAVLWGYQGVYSKQLNHAIVVSGVVYDDTGENLVGFYIHDTAAWMTRYISLEDMRAATLYHFDSAQSYEAVVGAVVENVKIGTNNINATGNKYSNVIYGNNGSNKIKGNGGNDFLYGLGGDDKIYGGSGKDFISAGEGNDYVSGGSGNDEIHGNTGNNTIYGGKGNDIIYDGDGDDYINCGSGKDKVVFSSDCGKNTLVSSSGTVTIKMDDEYQDLALDIDSKKLTISYDEDNLIEFAGFYNKSKNKCAKTYILDSDDVKTRIFVTKSKGKIKVGDKNTNNLLYSLSTKNNKITTSLYDDKVIMYGGNDTIKYTGGYDYYISYSGNNTYNIGNFSQDTNLKISDYEGNDRLNINSDKSNICLFVDYTNTGERNSDNLYIFDKNLVSSMTDFSDFLSDESKGFICIENYFGDGCVEDIYSLVGKTYEGLDISSALDEIQAAVQGWFGEHAGCDTVLDTIRQNDSIQDLIACYTDIDFA